MKKKILWLTFFASLLLAFFIFKTYSTPYMYLYAWERNEDFTFLEHVSQKDKVAVAYFDAHITLDREGVRIKRRVHSLVVPNSITSIPVVRIDADGSEWQSEQVAVDYVVQTCLKARPSSCQVDFDYVESQKQTYVSFVNDVLGRLSTTTNISFTGYASRCYDNEYYKEMKDIHIVPLFIDLDISDKPSSFSLRAQVCQKGIGFATYQALPPKSFLKNKDLYIFPDSPWTEELFSHWRNVLRF